MGTLALLGAAAVALLLAAGGFVYREMRWARRETLYDRFFSRPLAERRALRAEMERRSRRVAPILALAQRVARLPLPQVSFHGRRFLPACTKRSLERAVGYRPGPQDVFVATQMKCGTTWMQQIVYETLLRGRGDLSDAGHRHMYAVSPWIEATGAVRMQDAPVLGDPPRRIVKTHLDAELCPDGDEARFIYVARHPVACFASVVDFMRLVIGPLTPSGDELLDWYCSDEMTWGPWPDHVESWWRRAEERSNVLFLHYEEMLRDLPGAVDRVASFLGAPLTSEEREAVVAKSGFDYMKAHEEVFEMAPPGLLNDFGRAAGGGGFLVSGHAERGRDVGEAGRARIESFVRERLAGGHYPLARFYPDVATPPA